MHHCTDFFFLQKLDISLSLFSFDLKFFFCWEHLNFSICAGSCNPEIFSQKHFQLFSGGFEEAVLDMWLHLIEKSRGVLVFSAMFSCALYDEINSSACLPACLSV